MWRHIFALLALKFPKVWCYPVNVYHWERPRKLRRMLPQKTKGVAVFVLSVLQSLSSIIRPKKYKNCFILKNLTTKVYAYIYRQVRPLKRHHLA